MTSVRVEVMRYDVSCPVGGMMMIVKPGQVVKMCDWSPNDHSIATWYRSCAPRMGMGFDPPRIVIEDENDRSCAGLWNDGAGLGVRHS